MRKLIFPLLFLIAQISVAQIKTTKLTKATIPGGIKVEGTFVNAYTWTDTIGTNIVVLTETGETPGKVQNGEDADFNRNAGLSAQHYIKALAYELTWQVKDFVKDCPVEVEATFVKNAFTVTDLDKDGKSETWLVYRTSCRGDVSPSDMKIIMHEDDKKHAARGKTKNRGMKDAPGAGQYTFDAAFKTAPASFRQYASRLWKKYIME